MARTRRKVESPEVVAAGAAVVAGDSARSGKARAADAVLLALFLALTFLLGAFPLKDTDFWWHLRTGDLMREGAGVPHVDWYTFGAAGHPWIDLHWGFEVLLSWGYEFGGVPFLTLAKCAVTTLAIALLITARRKSGPLWVMVVAWLPALLLLGGRMYIRPETLTLLYLAIYLAVLFRWEERPRLAYVLPIVQLAWVNSHGLFVLGPIVLAFALADAAIRRDAFRPERRRWWRTVATACLLIGLACLVNPYGLQGALFPLELAGTMGDPVFSRTIAELQPVLPVLGGASYSFVEQMGFRNLPLQLHLTCLMLGAASFVVPTLWSGFARLARSRAEASVEPPAGRRKRQKVQAARTEGVGTGWKPSLFRLLLFTAFGLLSLKATRNSHQFAAIAGTVTAWNLGEWLSAIRRRRGPDRGGDRPLGGGTVVGLAAVLAVIGAVASGTFYAWTGEGRTIGLGEEPLWFPHAAVRKAGEAGMPDRFVCIHNGHSALYEYAHGPERKTYTDARLEVMGPELYSEYLALERQLADAAPGWEAALERLGSPGVLVDNVHPSFAPVTATLMASPAWSCVWFDPVATVFVPVTSPAARSRLDFAARHFRAGSKVPEIVTDIDAIRATAKAAFEVAYLLLQRGEVAVARPILLYGIGVGQTLARLAPDEAASWKWLGLLESVREPVGSLEQPVARFRKPWDPVFDLSAVRAIRALKRSLDLKADDMKVMVALAGLYQSRGMNAEALELMERLGRLDPPNQTRSVTAMARAMAAGQAEALRAKLGEEPSRSWSNQDELDRAVEARLERGWTRSAADLLEESHPPRSRSWPVADRLAALWMNLGETERARQAWRSAVNPPRPALVAARVAASHYADSQLDEARKAYEEALRAEPELYEALYGLACVERDAGRAAKAREVAEKAIRAAPTREAREAAEVVLRLAGGDERTGKP